jgi:glycosyltransferase involved in cell wall biosynthesis
MVAPSVKIPEPLAQSVHQYEFARNLVNMGIEVHLLCRRDDGLPSQEDGIAYHGVFSPDFPLDRLFFTRHTKSIVKTLLRERDFDIVHDRGYLFGGSGIAVARSSGIPTVLQIDDDWIKTEALVSRISATGLYKHMALRWCQRTLRRADYAFTVSESLRRVAVDKWGADATKTEVIPNGVDLDLFRPDVEPLGIRDMLGASDDPIVCFVGALGPWHGVDQLLRAFALALRSQPDMRLLLVGGAKEYEIGHLEVQAETLGIADRVRFHGRVEHHEIPRILVECDVAVAPYPHSDYGFSPLKIFEYMGCGLPVIASDVPSTREIVHQSENGMLVEAGNPNELAKAILDVLGDDDLAARLRQGALESAQDFSWRKSTEKLAELYEKALRG